MSLVVVIKAETKGNFHKFAYYITFWTKIAPENKLIFPRYVTIPQTAGLAESVYYLDQRVHNKGIVFDPL